MTSYRLDTYDTRAGASAAAAACLSAMVGNDLRRAGQASLVVSGGSTPRKCLRQLSGVSMAWEQVQVSVTDERVVDPSHEESNERMVRASLMRCCAEQAQFVGLTSEGFTDLIKPFSAVLVGMGEDGHFASIFPDMDRLDAALDIDNSEPLMKVNTKASSLERVTMTLSLLVRSRQIVLLAYGAAKKAVLDDPKGLPVMALLEQQVAPVRVIWAP